MAHLMRKKAGNLKIVDDDEGFGDVPSGEQEIKEFGSFEDSEDDLPVVVNEKEFLSQIYSVEKSPSKSPSPPRKTIEYKDDEDDDVVYRDKSGKRITRDQWLLLNQKGKKGKKEEPKQELVWGKGLVQKEQEKDRIENERKIMEQSFQNYDIDDDYDNELKDKKRWNDPINQRDLVDTEAGARDLPKCRFSGVPNRFNIEPGYRWDGVIRGNGYEQRWFQARADRSAKERDYYLQNVADL